MYTITFSRAETFKRVDLTYNTKHLNNNHLFYILHAETSYPYISCPGVHSESVQGGESVKHMGWPALPNVCVRRDKMGLRDLIQHKRVRSTQWGPYLICDVLSSISILDSLYDSVSFCHHPPHPQPNCLSFIFVFTFDKHEEMHFSS